MKNTFKSEEAAWLTNKTPKEYALYSVGYKYYAQIFLGEMEKYIPKYRSTMYQAVFAKIDELITACLQ